MAKADSLVRDVRVTSGELARLDPRIPEPEPRLEGVVVAPSTKLGRSTGPRGEPSTTMGPMDVESRDSVSLKPAELDELGQLASGVGLPLQDEQLDRHVEQFPLVAVAGDEGELYGFLFGSLERIGGTPCILWGLGVIRRGRQARPSLDGLVAELYRRAAISFPDEDVLVAGRVAHAAAYSLLSVLTDVCPRPKYTPNGEERAWGRRLARRFGCDARYDDRSFRLSAHHAPELVLDARTVKAGGKVAAELIGEVDPARGEAVIAYGWAMAEALADGLATPRH